MRSVVVWKFMVPLALVLSACGPDLDLSLPTSVPPDASLPKLRDAGNPPPDTIDTPADAGSGKDGGTDAGVDAGPGQDITAPVFGGVASVVSKSETTLDVSWTAATDDRTPATGIIYLVYFSTTTPVSTLGQPAKTVTGATTASLTGLSPGTKYYVLVRAKDEAGNVDKNAVQASTSTLDTTAPSVPTQVQASAAGPSVVNVTWTGSTDNGGSPSDLNYIVVVANASGGTAQPTARQLATQLGASTQKVTGLDPATDYYVAVRSQDLAGNLSALSAEVKVTTTADTKAPAFAGASMATPIGPDSVRVNWNAATDDATDAAKIVYTVFQGTAAGQENFTTPVATVTGGITTVIKGLTPATDYFYVVRATDGSGNTDTNTVEKTAKTQADTAAPTFAGVASVAQKSTTELDVTWNAATDNITAASAIVYNVYVAATTRGQNFTTPTGTVTGGTGYTVSGLTPNTTYFVVVRAKDAAGNEDKNTVEKSGATAQTPDTTAPTFAGVKTGGVVASGPTSLDVSWLSATDDRTVASGIKYDIYVATQSGQQDYNSPPALTVTGTLSATVSGLSPLTDYFIVVRARDAAGNRDTNTKEETAKTLDGTPPVFAGLTSATVASESTADLTWSAATDNISGSANISYRVFLATSAGGENYSNPKLNTAKGATSVTVTGLSPSTTYFIVVRAVDEAGNMDTNTVEKSITTPAAPDKTAPIFAGVSSVVATGGSSADLSWTGATDNVSATGNIYYRVYMATSSHTQNFSTPKVSTVPGATTTTVTGLAPATKYFFVVRAVDEAGNEDLNIAEKSVTTNDTIPPTFGGAASATGGAKQVVLTWSAASDNVSGTAVITYRVYMGTAAGGESFTTPKATTAAGATTATITGLADSTTYFFVVRAVDAAGNEEKNTVEVSATTTAPQVSFANDVAPIFSRNCAGCHTGGGASGGLSLDANVAYNNLVNVTSNVDSNLKRVVPNDTANSVIWIRTSGGNGNISPMPQGTAGLATTNNADFLTLEKWIQQGAQNN